MLHIDDVLLMTTPMLVISVHMIFRSIYEKCIWGKKIEVLSYLVFGAVSALTAIYVNTLVGYLAVNAISLILLQINYESCMRIKVIYGGVICGAFVFVRGFYTILSGLVVLTPHAQDGYDSITGVLVVRIIILVLAKLMVTLQRQKKSGTGLSASFVWSVVLVLGGTLYLFSFFVKSVEMGYLFELGDESEYSYSILIKSVSPNNLYILGGAAVVLMINLSITYSIENLQKVHLVRLERTVLIEQTRAYENQNQLINNTHSQVRGLKHDMNNHLMVLRELIERNKTEEMKDYIHNILEASTVDERVIDSGNFIFDSLINLKLKGVKDEGVLLDVNIEAPNEMKILAYDITIILGNLLDNSVKAVRQVESIEKKYQ